VAHLILAVDVLHQIMAFRLQPYLGGFYGVKKPMGLCLHRMCPRTLCGVGLVVDLVLTVLECGGADCC
jgi:hypothetical protein